MGCKRLTKWWYLQDEHEQHHRAVAVKGLQNGGIYKVAYPLDVLIHAVKGLQNGGIYKPSHPSRHLLLAVKGLQNGGNYKGRFYATLL